MKTGANILQLTRLCKILNACASTEDEVESSMPDEKVSTLWPKFIWILNLSCENSYEVLEKHLVHALN